jgi:hypothetical protein
MNSSTLYPSGVAALFASHAREGKPIAFLSAVDLELWGDGLMFAQIRKGDFVEATAALDGSKDFWVTLNCNTSLGLLSAADVNKLAGKKLVEE